MGGEVIHATGDINKLAIGETLTHFFNGAMDIAKVGFQLFYSFPVQCDDQVLSLEWKYLLPVSLFNLLLVTVVAIMGWHF